jgi:hypothetical protein
VRILLSNPLQSIAPLLGHALVDRKRQRRQTGVNEVVLLPTAKGLTTEGIAEHFAEVLSARVPDAKARITETVIGEMTARSPIWRTTPRAQSNRAGVFRVNRRTSAW